MVLLFDMCSFNHIRLLINSIIHLTVHLGTHTFKYVL